jgi:hypothetical protein
MSTKISAPSANLFSWLELSTELYTGFVDNPEITSCRARIERWRALLELEENARRFGVLSAEPRPPQRITHKTHVSPFT